MNYFWGFIVVISVIFAFFNGTVTETANAVTEGAGKAVEITVMLMGVMCLWSGIMKIASESGFVKIISRLLKPLTKFIFPKIPQSSPAMEAIVMNMTANILGMSNAATPLGLRAVSELSKYNGGNIASDAMCMLIVVNTASIQLIPATILTIRKNMGSQSVYGIIPTVWLASASALIVGVIAAKIFAKRDALND